jgi:hypothetical protein
MARQAWSDSGVADKRAGPLRAGMRAGYELPLFYATHFVLKFSEEVFLSHLVHWFSSAHVNLSIVSTTSGMCERLFTSLFVTMTQFVV